MRKPENLEAINKSFEVQAARFESKSVNFSNEYYLNMVMTNLLRWWQNYPENFGSIGIKMLILEYVPNM